MHRRLTRKDFLRSVIAVTAATLAPVPASSQAKPVDAISVDDLKEAQKLVGLSFTDDQLKEALPDVQNALKGFESLRALPITYEVEPPTIFTPLSHRPIKGKKGMSVRTSAASGLDKMNVADEEVLTTLSVRELGSLVKSGRVSSAQLTELSLKRLQQYGDKLLCVVTLMADQARADAAKADAEIKAGKYRGPLHGIPCGVKDLFATRGVPTTWGAGPYEDQSFDYDAAVVEKLRAAGAVICAKMSLGALAQGDVWFKGRTKNPWNPKQGSSGSSAGSAASVAACLLPFAIGTETLGSICSPSNQCRVTGLRPTYGRVSRRGAMAVSWTMDKIGPLCREAEDCALVFAAIAGADPGDRSSVDRPFHFTPEVDWEKLKIGYLIGPKDDPKDLSALGKTDYLKQLVGLGAKLSPIKFDPPNQQVLSVLEVEAAAAFDDLTRSERIALLKDSSWPETYRSNRFVPGVEYLRAQRARALLMESFETQFGDYDMFVAPGTGGFTLLTTNLTGHPQVLIPYGTNAQGNSRSVSFVGRLYEEAPLLAVASAFQKAAGFYKKHPDLAAL